MSSFSAIETDVEQVIAHSPLVIAPTAFVSHALELMGKSKWNEAIEEGTTIANPITTPNCCLLIVEQSQLLGIFTDRDAIRLSATGKNLSEIPLSEVMTRSVITVRRSELTDLTLPHQLLQQYGIRHLPVVDDQGKVVGLLTQDRLQQYRQTTQIESLQQRIAQLEAEKSGLLQQHTLRREAEIQARTREVRLQAERAQWLGAIAQRIRSSLDLQATLDAIVVEVRQWLECDRVLVYQFQSETGGIVLAESVAAGWQSFLGHRFAESCLACERFASDAFGDIHVVSDVLTATMSPGHRDLLLRLQVRAKLLLPILVGDRLWGLLLVAQNRGPRCWLPEDIELIQQISTHAAIAIQQAELYHHAQLEIQERQRIEIALRESEELYRTTLSNLSDAVLMTDRQGQLVFVGPNIHLLLGYTVAEVEQIGSIEALLGPDLFDWQQLMSQGEIFNIECEIQDKQNQRHTVLINIKLVQIGRGTVLYTCRDITDRKQMEKALQASEERLRTIVETSTSGYVTVNQQGTIVFANPAAAKMFGLSLTDLDEWLLGFPYPCGNMPENKHQTEMKLYQPSGGQCIATMRTAPIVWDGQKACLVSLTDITELKRAEESLRHSETKYRLLLENLPIGLLVVHATTLRILNSNAKACELLELSVEQMQGKATLDLEWQLLREDETPMGRMEYPLHRVLATNRPLQNYVMGMRRLQGETCMWMLVNAFPVFDRNHQLQQIVMTFVDISDRRQAEHQLHQLNLDLEQRVAQRTTELARANQLLTLVMDSIPQRIFWKDCDSVLLGCNHNFAADVGLTPEAVIGQKPQSLFGALTAIEASLEVDRQVIETGEPQLHRLATVQRSDQAMIWVESNKVPLRDTDGKIIGILETYEDISSRRSAEIARRESEQRLQDFLDNASDLIQSVSLQDGRFLYVNRIWQTIMGYSGEEAQSLKFLDLVAPQDWPACSHLFQQFQQGLLDRIEAMELALIAQDGRPVLLEGSITVRSEQGQPSIAHAIFHDITARRAAEIALQESQYLVQRIAEASPDILYIYDLQEYRNIYTNKEVFRLLGYSVEELQAMGSDLLLKLVHPEDIASLLNHHVDLTEAADTDILEIEYRVRDSSNNWHWFVSRDTVFSYDASHRPKQIIGAASEITERKQIEAKLRQTNAELAHATRLKDEFLANMSHELRTPLNAILGMSEGLRENAFGDLSDRQDHAISTIERSGRHLLELINDILDLSKIEAGKLEIQPEPVAVQYLCESSLSFVRQQAFQKQIRLQTEIQPRLGEISLDERRIRQVLINLLTNAVKFTPNGGSITLKVAVDSPDDSPINSPHRASTSSAPTQTYLSFSVIDTGIGIAAEDIEKLFQAFVQIDSSLNRQQSGTGLGLALAKQITEMHGGSIEVVSQIGKGSTFTVYLPYATGNFSNPLPKHLPQVELESIGLNVGELTSQPKILLVEDNQANIQTIAGYLESRGYQVVTAGDGQSGITTAQAELPDLILMDIQMPGMDGLEATRQIRLASELTNIPIIALTALAMPGDRDRCLAAGATDYLPKPVRLKQVVTLIQQLLSR